MITNISNGYVTFQHEDGESYCLTEKEYKEFETKNRNINLSDVEQDCSFADFDISIHNGLV